MSWPVGTIVVCVDAAPRTSNDSSFLLQEGAYYTIRAAGPPTLFTTGIIATPIWLNEVRRFTYRGFDDCWASVRFRKAESDHSEAGSVREVVHAR